MATVILAFDTSAAQCAAALLCDGRITLREEPMAKGQAERLLPMLEEMLAEAGLGWRDLDALAVGTGPGNFTGVRIAVAAARGLALSLGIPAIGVTRLEALAHDLPRPVTVIEDARRDEMYVQRFGADGPGPARLMQVGDVQAEGDVVGSVVGSGAGAVAPLAALAPRMALAEAMVRIAQARGLAPQPRPAPFYLRSADAAPPTDPPPVILDAVP